MREVIDLCQSRQQDDDGVLVDDDYEVDLSLCDLPLFGEDEEGSSGRSSTVDLRKSESELFEFFSDLTREMTSAEEIILCGRLVPFTERPSSLPSPPPPSPANQLCGMDELLRHQTRDDLSFTSSSVVDLGSTTSVFHRTRSAPGNSSFRPPMIRSSRSLNHGQLDRSRLCDDCSHEDTLCPRNKTTTITDTRNHASGKPSWSVRSLGLGVPPSHYGRMELRDIKNRQSRLHPPAIFTSGELTRNGIRRSVGKRYSCSILKVLSCKNHGSVDAQSPLCSPPPCESDRSASHVLYTS